MTPEDIEKVLVGERNRLVEKADARLRDSEVYLRDLRENMEKAVSGQKYRRRAGNNPLFSADPIDLSVVNAAYDAIERVAYLAGEVDA